MTPEKIIVQKTIKRKHGEGTLTVFEDENGNKEYKYDYRFAYEIGRQLKAGDISFIAEKLNLHQAYVSRIMQGERYHEGVIDFALLVIKNRAELMKIDI